MGSLEVSRRGVGKEGKVDEQVGAKTLVFVGKFGDKLYAHVGCWPLAADRRSLETRATLSWQSAYFLSRYDVWETRWVIGGSEWKHYLGMTMSAALVLALQMNGWYPFMN